MLVLGLLISFSVILGLTKNTNINTLDNKQQFSVQDTSAIDEINIISEASAIALQRKEGIWMLNDTLIAEQNIVKVLLAIIKDAEVVRNVPKSRKEEISEYIRNQGYEVEIKANGQSIKKYAVAGNETKTVSYMMEEEQDPAIVNIPGYDSYVAGIFEIPLNDWRDRVILSSSWRSLQNLSINYTQFPEYDLTIKFEFDFLKVEGVNSLDTARMMAYIDEFEQLQADRYLEKGQNASYDSLLQTPHTVTLTIEDVNPANSKTIDFYPLLLNDPMMLGYIREDSQRVLFEAGRIQKLFAVKDDFVAKKE